MTNTTSAPSLSAPAPAPSSSAPSSSAPSPSSSSSSSSSSEVGYSRTKVLGLFSLYDINRADIAVVLAAIEKVDTTFTQTVHVDTFVDLYVKDWGWVFRLLWDNYYELLHEIKEPLVVAGNDDGDAKDNSEHADEEKDEEKDEKDKADSERRRMLMDDRDRPDYFIFFGFLFFLISITDREELSRFVFFVWYARSRSKTPPSLETLLDVIPLLWGKKPSNKALVPKLIAKVRKSSKRLDMDEFDAAKFHILDFSTKGSWTKPIKKMQDEIKWRFAKPMVWYRIVEGVHTTFKTDIDVALDRLDCPRRKRGTKAYGDKGERRIVRQCVRKYLKLIKGFLELPRGEELDANRMNVLLAYAWPVVEYFKGLAVQAKKRLGLATDEPIHPSTSQSEETKQDHDDDDKKTKTKNGGGGGGGGGSDDDDDVPLEKKYRVALKVNVSVLNNKAVTAKELARKRLDCANDCVYDDFDFDVTSLVSK